MSQSHHDDAAYEEHAQWLLSHLDASASILKELGTVYSFKKLQLVATDVGWHWETVGDALVDAHRELCKRFELHQALTSNCLVILRGLENFLDIVGHKLGGFSIKHGFC